MTELASKEKLKEVTEFLQQANRIIVIASLDEDHMEFMHGVNSFEAIGILEQCKGHILNGRPSDPLSALLGEILNKGKSDSLSEKTKADEEQMLHDKSQQDEMRKKNSTKNEECSKRIIK